MQFIYKIVLPKVRGDGIERWMCFAAKNFEVQAWVFVADFFHELLGGSSHRHVFRREAPLSAHLQGYKVGSPWVLGLQLGQLGW